jgi:hypothetical protein
MPVLETITAVGGIVTGLITGVGGMWLRARRARADDRAADTDADRLAIEARDKHLDRLQREQERLDAALGATRREHEECLRMHRECLSKADRMAGRIAHLEERLDVVEQRDATPTSTERV